LNGATGAKRPDNRSIRHGNPQIRHQNEKICVNKLHNKNSVLRFGSTNNFFTQNSFIMRKQNNLPKKLSLQKRAIVNLSKQGKGFIGGGNKDDESWVVCFQSELNMCTTGGFSPGCFDKESKYHCNPKP
jgi:hypothetical protein